MRRRSFAEVCLLWSKVQVVSSMRGMACVSLFAMCVLLANCNGGGSQHSDTFTISGTVTGLSGTGLVLADNGGDKLAVTANGSFTFATPVARGGTYAVTVATQPSNPAQTCTVANGSGTVVGNVGTVTVACTTTAATYSIGGTVAGLSGSGLVLEDNGGDNLSVAAGATTFTFATKLASGSAYAVTVKTQPSSPAQNCVVSSGSGTATANVTSVAVTCTTVATTFSIGGAVSGLTGSGLVLQDNGGDNLSVAAGATSFTFATKIASGSAYAVTVKMQPSSPAQTCTVTNGTGTASANVTSVAVVCTTTTYSVGGTVSGLSGTGLVLQDNGGDNLAVSANGSFTFPTKVASGGAYAVTVHTQPSSPAQTCAVTNGSGTATANVTNATVACTTTTTTFSVGGTVSGLTGAGLVLQDNGGDNFTVTGNGSFTFATKIASGSAYAVTVKTQPSSPAQTCAVTNGSGTAAANVTNVTVACTTNAYTIGGTVSGLSGTGLVLQDNAGDNLAVTANGSFTFPAKIASGGAYAVTVHTQPSSPAQTCSVTSGTGTVTNANVTNVSVACTTTTTSYTVGGSVSGLNGTGLVLQDNGGDSLSVTTNGSFTFPTKIPSGSKYAITVATQPSTPAQNCVVTNGSGTVSGANVTNASVTCADVTSGSNIAVVVTGLLPNTSIVLQDNGADNLIVAANNKTTDFATPVTVGDPYAVTILTQPVGKTCVLSANASGTASASVTTVTVTCSVFIAGGEQFTCGLTTAGAVFCWGLNTEGQLGNGTTTRSFVPVPVTGLSSGVVQITAGQQFACALTSGGAVMCWGANSDGQLGDGTRTDSSVPVQVATLTSGVTAIASGQYHVCAITTASGAICWGDNGEGELGNGGAVYTGVADVTGLSSGVGEITSGSYYTCALTTGAAQMCWGEGGNGQLAAGTTTTGTTTPIASLDPAGTAPLTNMLSTAAGYDSACGVVNDGTVLCWGDNSSGELGDGSVSAGNSFLPVQVVSTSGSGTLGNILELGTGENFTCSVNTTGGVVCWGSNSSGQLGFSGTTFYDEPKPTQNLSSGAIEIAAGYHHACAITKAGRVECWGSNSTGQLGNGTTTDSTAPVTVVGASGTGTFQIF